MTDVAGFLVGLETWRGKLDRVIEATRDLLSLAPTNGAAPVAEEPPARRAIARPGRKALPAPKATKVTSTGRLSLGPDEVARRQARARDLWIGGKAVGEIATAVGVSMATVYGWSSKEKWPARGGGGRPRAASRSPETAPVERPTFMCKECRQKGFDPKRCDNCFEKR